MATETEAPISLSSPASEPVSLEAADDPVASTEADTTEDAPAQVDPPTDEAIVEAMRSIIKSHDIGEITLRMLMGLLEVRFGQALTNRKSFVKDNIPVLLAELPKEEEVKEEDGEGEEGASVKVEAGDAEATNISGDDKETQEVLNAEDVEVQKLLWEQSKYGTGRVTRGRTSGRPAPKPAKPKKRKSADNEEDDGEEQPTKKKKGTSRANRPKELSPALAHFLGATTMPRPDVVKKLHEYIKEHNLQNPKNKKQILFDDRLEQVFKRKTTDYFKLNTLLTKHLTDPGELV